MQTGPLRKGVNPFQETQALFRPITGCQRRSSAGFMAMMNSPSLPSTAAKYSNSAAAKRHSARLLHAQRASLRLTVGQAVTLQASGFPVHLPDLWLAYARGRSGKAIWSGIRWRYPSASTAAHARAMTPRSQLPPFVGVPERSTARLAGVNRRTLLNLGLRICKIRLGSRPHESSVVSSTAGTGIILSTTSIGPRPTVGWQARFASAVGKGRI